MSETEAQKIDPIEKFKKQKISAVISIAYITLIVIGIFTALGFGLDYLFNTKPWLLIACLVVSFPITQVVVIKKIRRDISKDK